MNLKLVAVWIGPCFACTLLILFVWVLYKKKLVQRSSPPTLPQRQYFPQEHSISTISKTQLFGLYEPTTIEPISTKQHTSIKSKITSIPEYSEWLESVHESSSKLPTKNRLSEKGYIMGLKKNTWKLGGLKYVPKAQKKKKRKSFWRRTGVDSMANSSVYDTFNVW